MLPTVPEASKNKTESGLIKTIKSIKKKKKLFENLITKSKHF